jgi:hypothetical protein
MTFAKLLCAVLVTAVSTSLAAQEANSAQLTVQQEEPATRSFRLTGRVVDELTGDPLGGVTVRLQVQQPFYFNPRAAPPPNPFREAITNADGDFAFDGIPDNTVDLSAGYPRGYMGGYDLVHVPTTGIILEALKPGYRALWDFRRRPEEPGGELKVSSRTGPVLVRLAPMTSLSVGVHGSPGIPLGNRAEIHLIRLGARDGHPEPREIYETSRREGTFTFTDLEPGRYYLIASPSTYQNPIRYESGRAIGELQTRYPASTGSDPKPFFIVHEGEHLHLDVQFLEGTVHRISVHGSVDPLIATNILDEHGIYVGEFHYQLSGSEVEVWLPDGRYQVEGNVSGSTHFVVAGVDRSDLHFRARPQYWPAHVRVRLDVSSLASAESVCPQRPQGQGCGAVEIAMHQLLPDGAVGQPTSTSYAEFDLTNPHKALFVSLPPGDYTMTTESSLNLYARSVQSGTSNLAMQPLVIRERQRHPPIRIIFAEGTSVDGVAYRDNVPCQAQIYAVPLNTKRTEFRAFRPTVSWQNGTFHLSGLAPGSYLVFASNFDPELDLHDQDSIAYWRAHGKIVSVRRDKPATIDLVATDPPNSK